MSPRSSLCLALTLGWGFVAPSAPADGPVNADRPTRERAIAALARAGRYYTGRVAVRGGYVYFTSEDLTRRWGEGEATPTQVWVQPPGTPTVGEAFLNAHEATGDPAHLAAATAAGEALVYGQLKSGGWTNKIDFDPAGDPAAYRNGRGGKRNHSSLDDGQTPSALRLLIRLDVAHRGDHGEIAEAAAVGLDSLLAAQFPGGGFPQVYTGPVGDRPVLPAALPAGDWRELPRVKEYWYLPTLNDGLAGQVAATLRLGRIAYADRDPRRSARCDAALRRLGDFLIRAQLPRPQPGWAQQYDDAMRPAWARPFEPPAVASSESQDVIETLLDLHAATGEPRFLDPIPAALDYLDRSALPDGSLPRYLELGTNRPLYMTRSGRRYEPTYSDANLPGHYGWKRHSHVEKLRRRWRRQTAGEPAPEPDPAATAAAALRAIDALDARGRWLDVGDGSRLVGQNRFPTDTRYLSSETFAEHMTALAAYLEEGP